MQDFRRLRVWTRAHQLSVDVYKATDKLPRGRRGAVAARLRRATASIPANIAEGCGHDGRRELARFLQIAVASAASEVENHLLLARDLEIMDDKTFKSQENQVRDVRRMLTGLIRRVRAQPATGDTSGAPRTTDDGPLGDSVTSVDPLPAPHLKSH